MTMSSELKPCPFCGGGNVKTFGPVGWYRVWGISHSCKAFYTGTSEVFQGFPSEAAAVAAWNTREPATETAPDLLEALKSIVVNAEAQVLALKNGGSLKPFDLPSAIEEARAALAKAEGAS